MIDPDHSLKVNSTTNLTLSGLELDALNRTEDGWLQRFHFRWAVQGCCCTLVVT